MNILNDNYKTISVDFRHSVLLILWPLFLLGACTKQEYIAEPINSEFIHQDIIQQSFSQPEFQTFIRETKLDVSNASKNLNFLTLALFYFNPEIRSQIKNIPILQAQKILDLTRKNPSVQIPLEYHSELFDGDSPWTIGLITEFFYERRGKRIAKAQIADAKIETTRILIEQLAWELQKELFNAYWDFYLNQNQLAIIQNEIDLKKEVISLLKKRQEFGESNNFEISTARLSLQSELIEQSQFKRNMHEAYHKILSLIGIDKSKLKIDELSYGQSLKRYTDIEIPNDVLTEAALHQRADFRAALQTYIQNEAELLLAIELQYPDINLSPGFVFDQGDKVLSLGLSWIAPLLHNNEPGIHRALKVRDKQRQEIIELQTTILNQLQYRLNDFKLRLEARALAVELSREFQKRHELIKIQFELAAIDKLDYLRAELERVDLEQSLIKLTVEAVIALGELQAIVQYPIYQQVNIRDTITRLIELNLGSLQ